MSDEKYDAAMNILSRLDPNNLEENLNRLIHLEPELASDLLSSVDIPLLIKKDPKHNNKEFLCCDYNRDIDSHRSPWSNEYFPEPSAKDLQDAPFPSPDLRDLEVLCNDSMDIYRDLYYEGGISSVYLWNLDENENTDSFAGVILFKKGYKSLNHWDSIHVVDVTKETELLATYRITTTIILHLENATKNNITLSGNLTRQTEKTISLLASNSSQKQLYISHITNLGTIIEDIESQMRRLLEVVYFDKTKDIYHQLRNGTIRSQPFDVNLNNEILKGLQNM